MDGFLLDRGFQVFLDAYPEAGALLDKDKLDLRAFRPGALIYRNFGMVRMMDVFREPRHQMESALAPVGSFADKLRVARLRWRLIRLTTEEIAGHEDLTTETYLRRAGFSPPMIDGFFRSFYGGIFLERELQTSSRMFEFTLFIHEHRFERRGPAECIMHDTVTHQWGRAWWGRLVSETGARIYLNLLFKYRHYRTRKWAMTA